VYISGVHTCVSMVGVTIALAACVLPESPGKMMGSGGI
jgi:hypothetical protein